MKYFQFIRNVVLLVLLGTLAGCQNDELIVDMGQGQDKIVLSFSDAGHSMTRVSSQEDYTTPTDVEKAVTHIDVFVLKNDMIDYYERISTGGADDKVTLGKTKRDFDPNVDYTIYAVANCTEFSEADIQTQIKDQSLADLNDLKALRVTTNNIHVTGMEAGVADVPETFMMDGHSTPVILNDNNFKQNTEVNVELRRAAAKVTIILTCGEHASFLPLDNTSTSGQVLRRVVNFANSTSILQPDDEDKFDSGELFTNIGNSAVGVEHLDKAVGSDGKETFKRVGITVYSYSNNWEGKEALTHESYLIVRIPLSYQAGDPSQTEIQYDNYYKIPLSGNNNHQLKRNHSYFTSIKVDALGAKEPDEPITLQPAFFKVQEWVSADIEIGGDMDHPQYLALSMDTLRINNATDDSTVAFATSSMIEQSDIHIEEVYIINKFGQKQTVSDPEVLITTSPELNGKVTVHSVLPENSLSVRYIVVSITNKDGITKKLVIEQYPLEYVTNTQGGYSYRDDFDNGSGTPTTYIYRGTSPYRIGAREWSSGKWTYSYYEGSNSDFFASKVVTRYNASGSNAGKSAINYYSWYTKRGNRYTESNTVVDGDQVFSSSTGNARMYRVQITSTPKNADYVLGLPKLDENGYTSAGDDNAKIVSPSFMIASQLGAVMPADNLEQAQKHCGQYVEVTNRGNRTDNKDVVAYHDWRLPTQAEIKIILNYQENSDAIDRVMTYSSYWSANGLVSNPNASSSSTRAVRCIRDAYKDGESK